jgi:hypothetical protein
MFIVAVVIGLGWWGYSKLEWVEKSIDLGFESEARKNPFLAAMGYLKAKEIPVTDLRRWNDLDTLSDDSKGGGIGTLVVASNRQLLSHRRQQQLWDWVRDGGHVIAVGQSFTNKKTGINTDDILNRLSLNLYPAKTTKTSAKFTGRSRQQAYRPWLMRANKYDDKTCSQEGDPVEINFRGVDEPIKVAFTPGLLLQDASDEAENWASNKDGIQIIQYQVGDGLVTVMTDISIWSNAKIACFDHAYFLSLLTRDGGGVGFLYNSKVISLWQSLWKYAADIVFLALIILLLWIWKSSVRFGPLIAEDRQTRREMGEHLAASALFLWRQEKYQELYRSLRESVLSAVARRRQNANKLNANEISQLVSDMTHIDKHDVYWALTVKECRDKKTIQRLIQTLQKIRNGI